MVAGIYIRLSVDREGSRSLQRQEDECRRWCAAHDLEIATVYADRGVSGFSPSARRTGFDRAIAALRAGEIDVLVVWKLDRLSRHGIGQVGGLLDDLQAAGGRLVSVVDALDTAQPQSRMLIAILAELARAESENTSIRVRSARQRNRELGEVVGGLRPYGYRVDEHRKLVPVEPAASILRGAIDSIIEGASLQKACRELNAVGLTNSQGRPWRVSTLSAAIGSPLLAGLIPARHVRSAGGGTAVGRRPAYVDTVTGQPVSCMAQGHDPIVSREVQQQLLNTLDARRRRYGRGSTVAVRTAAALLQGGLLRCASCQRAMVAFGHSYRCRRRNELPQSDCALPANVGVKLLDTTIVDLWCANVARLPATSPARRCIAREWAAEVGPLDTGTASTLQAWREARAALANADYAHFVRGQLDEPRYARVNTVLAARIAALELDIECAQSSDLQHGLRDPGQLRALWDNSPAEQRRRQLRNGIERIWVVKARRPGISFDHEERLQITWRT